MFRIASEDEQRALLWPRSRQPVQTRGIYNMSGGPTIGVDANGRALSTYNMSGGPTAGVTPDGKPIGGGYNGPSAAGWGALAMQVGEMLANAQAEKRARGAAKDDLSAQFAGEMSDFPQYEYQGRKKRQELRDKFGGPGLGNLFGLLG